MEPSAAPIEAPAVAQPPPPTLYEGRPASVSINSVELQGNAVATDPETRPWSERITPVAIRYPGIDLASGLYQDIAAERRDAFTAWLAEKWIDKNARCNRIFQRDPRRAAWEGPPDEGMLQCSELNRPSQDLKPVCSAPATAQWTSGVLRLRWLCTMAPNTAPFLYEEANPSPKAGTIALAVNPASKERSRIPIEAPTP